MHREVKPRSKRMARRRQNYFDHWRHAAAWPGDGGRVAARGHTVVVADGRCRKSTNSGARFPKPHNFQAVDVASDQQVKSWASALLSRMARRSCCSTTPGLSIATRRCGSAATEFQLVVDVNLKGVANVIRHFVPAMVKRQARHREFQFWLGAFDRRGVRAVCATKWAMKG